MTDRVNFILAFNGVTYRFASLLTGDDLLRAVRAKVAAIVNCKEAEMYWRDDESDVVLETVEDLATAIDYAKATRRKPSKTPCVTLVAVVSAPAEEKSDEESTAATVDDLVDGLQKVTIAEEAVEPWQTMFSPPRVVNVRGELMGIPLKLQRMMKELDVTEANIAEILEAVAANGRDLEKLKNLQKMWETRKETAATAAKVDAASCRLRVDDGNSIYRATSPSRKQRRTKSTVEEQKRIREHSIRFLSDDFPERYSMAAAAIVNSERRMMTRREITEWAKITFPAFKALGVRYKDDICKSLRNTDCFVKVPRPSKEESKGNLWTINPKYVIDEQMHLECAQNVTQLLEPVDQVKNAVKANSALQQEGMLSPTKEKEAQHARKDWKIYFDITAAERIVDKTRKITDWAQPVAAAAAAPTAEVYRVSMKKASREPTGLRGTPRDITPAERVVRKEKKITDWAQPMAATASAPTTEVYRSAMKKAVASQARHSTWLEQLLSSQLRAISSAEKIAKKERKITDWARPEKPCLGAKCREIKPTERIAKKEKKITKITDWARPVAAPLCSQPHLGARGKKSAERIVKKEAKITDWARPVPPCLGAKCRDITSAEKIVKKEKKITDWARPVQPCLGARDITAAARIAKKEKKVKKITDWARPEPSRLGAKCHNITSAERIAKKAKKITDWARPVTAASPLCSSPRLGARDKKSAERIAKKEKKITDWARPVPSCLGAKCRDITSAERIVKKQEKKEKKITDWARPVSTAAPKIKCSAALQRQGSPVTKEAYLERPCLERMETGWKVMKTDWTQRVAAAALKTKRAAKITQEHNKNAASAALQREGVFKAPMKKEAASEKPGLKAIDGALRKETPVKTKVFVSYRRKSGESLASLVRVLLQLRGYEALMVTDKWDARTLEAMIKGTQHFIAVLTPKSLHDFDHGDRFHKELRCAFAHRKPIIPMFDQFFEFPEDEDAIPQDIRRIASLSGVRWVHAYQEQCMNHVERKMRSNEKTAVPIEVAAAAWSPVKVDAEIAQPLTPIYAPAKTKKKEVEDKEEGEADETPKALNVKVYISYRRGPDDELASLIKAHLIQRGYEDFVNENDDSEPLAAKVKSAAHFVVLLTPYSFEYFKRDSVFSKELQCAIAHKKHLVFIVGKHFEYPAHECRREDPIPKDIRKLLDETEKGGYVSIMWNNEDQDESMDKLQRMLRNADHSQFNDRRCKKNQEQRKRELDVITQAFKKDLQKREREFHQMMAAEAATAAPEAQAIKAEVTQVLASVEKEVEQVDEVKVGKESREPAEPSFLKVRMAERRKREQRELRQRENERRQKRVLKRLVKSKMRQLKKAVGAAAAEAEPAKAEMQQANPPAEEKEWEEVDEVEEQVKEDEWSHGEESSNEDDEEVNAKHYDEWCYDEAENDIFLASEDVGVEKKEEGDEWAFDEEDDAVFEKMVTEDAVEDEKEDIFEEVSTEDAVKEDDSTEEAMGLSDEEDDCFEKVVTEDSGEDHSDEWSCEDVKDTEEDQDDENLTSVSDSSDDAEAELSIREEQLAVKEEAFERRMAEYAVKIAEMEEKMKGLEKRVERIEKEKKENDADYDTDQEYDDLLGEREAARSALPALREEIQATLLAQTMKYKMKK